MDLNALHFFHAITQGTIPSSLLKLPCILVKLDDSPLPKAISDSAACVSIQVVPWALNAILANPCLSLPEEIPSQFTWHLHPLDMYFLHSMLFFTS